MQGPRQRCCLCLGEVPSDRTLTVETGEGRLARLDQKGRYHFAMEIDAQKLVKILLRHLVP